MSKRVSAGSRRKAVSKRSAKSRTSPAKVLAGDVQRMAVTAAIIGLVAVLITGALWYNQVYMSNRTIFWSMVEQNLATPGFSRHIRQEEGNDKSIEYTRFNFTGQPTVELGRTISNAEGTTVTEGLGTSEEDFQRFTKVERTAEGEGQPNFNAVLNTWVRINDNGLEGQEEVAPTLLLRSSLGPVIAGNLQPQQRKEIIQYMKDKAVFNVNYDEATKEERSGQSVVILPTTIQLRPYVETLKKYADAAGLPGRESINVEEYGQTDTLEVRYIIDRYSRQLLAVEYVGQNIIEEYDGHGISRTVKTPQNSINATEFQEKLQGTAQ